MLRRLGLIGLPLVMMMAQDLRVSENRRYLVRSDGTAFFYLGDTAWELFHRLNREDADEYLENRRQKGFSVIQAVALAELDGLSVANAYGHLPLVDRDPSKPNEAYFAHADWIIRKAAEKGLIIGLLPTWGEKVVTAPWQKTPGVIFNEANARVYGRWIGTRYKNTPNLIWVLGGDRDAKEVVAVWRAMAQGIREGDGGRHLQTYHPPGGKSSSESLHDEAWLDFNLMQSGHAAKNLRNDLMIETDYARKPVKPVIDAEPRYENHPVNWKPKELGWFDDFDVRQAAYWAVLAGAAGHTYGCHDIWQMAAAGRESVGLARGDWRSSLNLPGAYQVGYMRRLMESRPMLSRVPAQELLIDPPAGEATQRLMKGDGHLLAYTPMGQPITIKVGELPWKESVAWWYDPRVGKAQEIGRVKHDATHRFTVPGTPARGNDWVLVLDDPSKGFSRPGASR